MRLCLLFFISVLMWSTLSGNAEARHRRHHHYPRVVVVDGWGHCWLRHQHHWWLIGCPA